jgi:alcohol dehydrogenase class IV
VLIVTRRLPKELEAVLNQNQIKYVIYGNTKPNPTVENVEEALKIYTENKCEAIIAIGGGSPIDCAKAVGARVAYPKKALNRLGGPLRILKKIPTLIAIPTTAGTGSEVTLAAVITDTEVQKKYALMSFSLIPDYAMLDASLTYSLPPHLTATTGMDALTHAVEAYIGRATTRQTRVLSLEAVGMIFKSLERAYIDGNNKEAREDMLLASYKAGMAFSRSYVGYVHAIAHSLGGRYDTPHGLANAVILPHVLEGYGSCIHKRLHELGVAAGVSDKSDSHSDGAKKFIEAIVNLNKKTNIPSKLSEIRKEDIPSLAEHAEKEANPLYPVPKLMTRKELEKFYYKIADWS